MSPLRIFISHVQEDSEHHNALKAHLHGLAIPGGFRIEPDQDQANLLLLLVTATYLERLPVENDVLERAIRSLEEHQWVVPIQLKSLYLEGRRPLHGRILQSGKSAIVMEGTDHDDAWATVVQRIQEFCQAPEFAERMNTAAPGFRSSSMLRLPAGEPLELAGDERGRPMPRLRFSDLPLGYLPSRSGHLPARSSHLALCERVFFGREGTMLAVATYLKAQLPRDQAPSRPRAVVLHGMPGIGKTALALQIAYHYGPYFESVGWLSMSNKDAVRYDALAWYEALRAIPASEAEHIPVEERLHQLQRMLCEETPRLLIFDDCQDQKLLETWLPRTGGCVVLVTSTQSSWDPNLGIQPIPLGLPSPEDSVKILHKYVENCIHCKQLPVDASDFHAIAEVVKHYPLALRLAGVYLADCLDSSQRSNYVKALRSRSPEEVIKLLDEQEEDQESSRSIQQSFMLAFRCLDTKKPVDDLAQTMLHNAARLAPGEPIPSVLLRCLLPPGPDKKLHSAWRRLRNLGLLVQRPDDAWDLHPLLAACVRRMPQKPQQPAPEDGIQESPGAGCHADPVERRQRTPEENILNLFLALLEPNEVHHCETRRRIADELHARVIPEEMRLRKAGLFPALQAHVRFVVNAAFERFWEAGQIDEAVGLQQLAMPFFLRWGDYSLILDRHLILRDAPLYAGDKVWNWSNAARVYLNQGQMRDSLAAVSQGLETLDRCSTELAAIEQERHRAALLLLAGEIHRHLGEEEAAARRLDEAHAAAQRGERPSLALKARLNLGNLYLDQGDLRRARQVYDEALYEAAQDPALDTESANLVRLNLALLTV